MEIHEIINLINNLRSDKIMVLELISWAMFVFFGGFLIFAIQNFVKRTTELTFLFHDLRLAVSELRAAIKNQDQRSIERERSVNAHLEKHDRYIKDIWKLVNNHETSIQLLKRD